MNEKQAAATISLSDAQLTAVDRFREDRKLASREAAVGWLLDIALESVTSTGRRYWDKPIVGGSRTSQS